MAKSRRKKKRESTARRRAENRKSGFESTCLNLPEGVSRFGLKRAGNVRIDVIPFKAGAGNPFADEGELHFERTYWAHRNVGPDNSMYVCPAKTAKKKCPICEHRAKMASDPDADEDLIKDLAPKERQLWNVIDLKDPDKGVQVWDISFHLFGKYLDQRIKLIDEEDEDEEGEFFYELTSEDGGMTLRLGVEEKSFGGNSFYEASTVDFKPRKKDYDEEILEDAQCLDELLIIPDYDKLKDIFLQVEKEDDDEDEDEKPKKERKTSKSKSDKKKSSKSKSKSKKKETAEDFGLEEGDEVEHEEWGDCRIIRISKDGTSLTLEDEDGDKHKAIAPSEVEKLEEKPKKSSKKSKKDEDDEDDEPEEDGDWEDEKDEDDEDEKDTDDEDDDDDDDWD